MNEKRKTVLRAVGSLLTNFLIFFSVIAFVVTCTFLVFPSSVTLREEDVRAFAPVVFQNIFLMTALFMAADAIRRKVTVNNPTGEIQKALRRLMMGDFSARVHIKKRITQEARFQDIAESVNALAEELSSVETLRTDFIANVSHEMKTPLAVMQNYGTLLQTPGLSEEKRLEYAKSVTDGARRLSDMMGNILRLNRLENQQIYPQTAEYDLGEQLCACLLQYESVWEREDIEIVTDIAESITVKADAELLELVWNNLLSNAFKFTSRGGTVAVSLQATDTHAVVQVRDTGCGMTPQVGAHIFEKFYQGDSSHATQGNGLGLALVKRVVDILHGEITVESMFGKGSTFTVKIRR